MKKNSTVKSKSNTTRATSPESQKMDWRNQLSSRFLSDYAIPFTRLIEAKLVGLQHQIEASK